MWPFSTLGWPEKTDALEEFYPGNVLVTGFDIIFFWVARMIMFGMKFMDDVPFREVYIHGLIRDQDGQKMSKSKGNVLDPLDLIDGIDLETLVKKRTAGMMQEHLAPKIEKATRQHFPDGIDAFGCDALRMTFGALATTGRDIRFDLGRIEGYKNFCNKLWNAARYVLMNTEELDAGDVEFSCGRSLDSSTPRRDNARNAQTLPTYRLDLAVQAIYEFTWHEFCDWYLELSKPVLQSDESSVELQRGTRRTLIDVLEALLRLLHPLMPFVTEEIWEQVAERAGIEGETIMLRPYPEASMTPRRRGRRRYRVGQAVHPGYPADSRRNGYLTGQGFARSLAACGASDQLRAATHAPLLQRVGRVESISILADGDEPPAAATALLGDMRLLVPMKGLIDVEAERARLDKQMDKVRAELAKANGKLGNEKFVNNAPPAVVAQERERVADFEKTLTHLSEQLQKLDELA